MRLLLICSTFHPVVGGAETYAFEVARGMASRGHQVTVITDLPAGGTPGHSFPGDPVGVTVHRLWKYREQLTVSGAIPWEQMAFGLLPEVAACLDETEPDLVLSNSLDSAFLGKMVSLELSIPWVAAFHEQAPEMEALGHARLGLVYSVLSPSLVIAGSEFYAARARRWGAAPRTQLIYHGIDTRRFHPSVRGTATRLRYGFSQSDVVIACAGRLKARKGLRQLLVAFARTHRAHPASRLLIVGSTNSASMDYARQLDEDIARLGISSVVRIDQTVTFQQMPGLLAAADIVAQPSLEEGLGLAVLEAMSACKPVVTTDIPGIREITVGGEVALVVPPGEPEPLADAMDSLIRSPALRARLTTNARRLVETRFSREAMLEALEASLLTTVGTRRTNAEMDEKCTSGPLS